MENRMKKWIVFGAGAFGREVYYYYKKENIAYFVDNDLNRIGETFFGKEIISFKKYCRIYDQYYTVIAARQYSSIERQLLENGITEYTIYLEQRENKKVSDPPDCYKNYLYAPTYITRIEGIYFIVDCWHHRIIYSPVLECQISEWRVLDDTLAGPHSIVSDGEVYIVDDTDHGELCVYKKKKEGFIKVQTIYGLGFRPHKCIYDESRRFFYILLSESCEIAILKNNHGQVMVETILKIEIESYYARSIQIIDDKLFLVSRNGDICELLPHMSGIEIVKQYKMPDEYAGLNDIVKVRDSYYLSVYTDLKGRYISKVVKIKDLNELYNIEDVTERIKIKGVPYYFSEIEGRYYLTEIDTCSGIVSFSADGDDLADKKQHYLFENIHNCSLKRRYGIRNSYDLKVAGNLNIAIGVLKNIHSRVNKLKGYMIPQTVNFYIGKERENLLNWYPFCSGSSALEIVSECGSIADILCERCKAVTSLVPDERTGELVRSLCAGYKNIEICKHGIPYEKKYHYILALNLSAEKLDRLLEYSQSYLKEDGTIIAVTNNRFSRKYWSDQEQSALFRREEASRKEIELICKRRKKRCSFYYPLPDWMTCEMISSDFSESSLGSDILERIYYSKPIHNTGFLQLIENHAVALMANSFLLEILNIEDQRKEMPAINILSTKRKREYQVNTKILEDGRVEKCPVYRSGNLHIENIKKNEMLLESRGIPILKGEMRDKKYIVDFLGQDTLDKHIYDLCKSGNLEEVFRLLETLKGYINLSSNHILYNGMDVLEIGYPDMVCQNVFFENGKFLFFDQEWTINYVEAGFIFYRAIKQLYINNVELEGGLPMKKMLEVFRMKTCEKYDKIDIMFRNRVHGIE